MEDQKRIMTPNSQSSNSNLTTSIISSTHHNKSTNDDPEFGKEHEWKRLSLMLICYIFFILALAFNFLQSVFWAPNSGMYLFFKVKK